MSHGKCFYCERRLADDEGEVDHRVAVSARPDMAFEWSNLYLSCRQCNKWKAGADPSPALDPCDASHDPAEHLTFEEERIEPQRSSPRGQATISMHRLDRQELDLARSGALRSLELAVRKVLLAQRDSGRTEMTPEEHDLLRQYAGESRPFSLMMRVALERLGV